MEPIFENVYTDTEEMFREQYNRSGWVMRAVWVAVFLCLIVYYGIVLLTEQSLFYLLIVLIYLAYLVYMLLVPWIRAKRHMKNELTEYGGMLPQTVVQFFENEVTAKYGRTTNTISYEHKSFRNMVRCFIIIISTIHCRINIKCFIPNISIIFFHKN